MNSFLRLYLSLFFFFSLSCIFVPSFVHCGGRRNPPPPPPDPCAGLANFEWIAPGLWRINPILAQRNCPAPPTSSIPNAPPDATCNWAVGCGPANPLGPCIPPVVLVAPSRSLHNWWRSRWIRPNWNSRRRRNNFYNNPYRSNWNSPWKARSRRFYEAEQQ
jgi:hypothetical protein